MGKNLHKILIFIFAGILLLTIVAASEEFNSDSDTKEIEGIIQKSVSRDSYKVVYINSCGNLKRPNTTYILRKDVVAKKDCFIVWANNITIDGRGHSVTYSK